MSGDKGRREISHLVDREKQSGDSRERRRRRGNQKTKKRGDKHELRGGANSSSHDDEEAMNVLLRIPTVAINYRSGRGVTQDGLPFAFAGISFRCSPFYTLIIQF